MNRSCRLVFCSFAYKYSLTVIVVTLVTFFRENVGLLGLTRVGSRRVVQISAGFMIFFATLGWYYIFGQGSLRMFERRAPPFLFAFLIHAKWWKILFHWSVHRLELKPFVVPYFVSSISFSNNKYFAIFAGKFGAVFASIPFPIFAALYCVLFGLVGMSLAKWIQFSTFFPVTP